MPELSYLLQISFLTSFNVRTRTATYPGKECCCSASPESNVTPHSEDAMTTLWSHHLLDVKDGGGYYVTSPDFSLHLC